MSVRIADGVKPSEYGRREAFRVHQGLRKQGRVRVPREFVFMDRAAIGLGGVFLHLDARLNFYRLFNEAIEKFSLAEVAKRQNAALKKAGLDEVGGRVTRKRRICPPPLPLPPNWANSPQDSI